MAVRNGATRSVFFGQITPEMDEAYFRKELERFGPIDQVKILGDKRVAFVHFVSINAAIKCVQTLPTEESFKEFKINYGRVRLKFVDDSGYFCGVTLEAPSPQG